MITAVDTNVLLDVFSDDPAFRDRSLRALRRCLSDGLLVACDVVWAEVAAAFADAQEAARAMAGVPVEYSVIETSSALIAGDAWRTYRRSGGPKPRIIGDFLVGAHAMEQADRLLTRDRGFQRAAFGELTILDPSIP